MDISNLRKSTATVEAGDWVDGIPQMGELRLRVRGLNSAQYKAIFSRKQRAVPKDQRERDGSVKDDVLHRIRGEALHEAILLDWSGLTSNNQPVPFDPGQALAWLTDPEFEDFQFAVLYAAGVVGKDRSDAGQALAKNSKAPSAGK
jgi:hypothetical protein